MTMMLVVLFLCVLVVVVCLVVVAVGLFSMSVSVLVLVLYHLLLWAVFAVLAADVGFADNCFWRYKHEESARLSPLCPWMEN